MSWIVSSESEESFDSDGIQLNLQGMNYNRTEIPTKNLTTSDINFLVNQVISSNATNSFTSLRESLKMYLTNWQIFQLKNVKESELGVRCLLNSWLVKQNDLQEGSFCNATWDNVYCWPATPLRTIVNQTCVNAFKKTEPMYAPHLKGHGYRICLANGSWLWNEWTNYTECADSFDAFVEGMGKHAEENRMVTTVQYILFIGSILSLVFMLSAVITFYKFRSLWCDRVTIHVHLMAALMLRYVMLLVITEPHIFNRSESYRSDDGICKGVLVVYLYATLSSINWMFIQGVYINSKLTTNVFDSRAPFKIYYTFGWLFPLVLMTVWATFMKFNHKVHCWTGYAAMNEIWIIIGPMVFALIVNFIILINILRVMLTKVRTSRPSTDAMQFRRAAKATLFLFPLLGINNLLVLYNSGGDLHKYFVILNTLLSSAQGIFVAIGYCYLSNDVRSAFRRVYRRFLARRNANNFRQCESTQNRHNGNSAAGPVLHLEQIENSPIVYPRTTSSINRSQSCPIINNKSLKSSKSSIPEAYINIPNEKKSSQNMLNANNISNPSPFSVQQASTSFENPQVECTNNWHDSVPPPLEYQSFVSSKRSSSLESPEHLGNISGSRDARIWKVSNV